MNTSAYQKRLEKEHKKFIKSIKTTNDVWDKLLVDTLTINVSWMFDEISHLFSYSKENDEQVEITLCYTNRLNGIQTKKSAWINKKQ